MSYVVSPVLENTVDDRLGKGDSQTAQLLSLVLELLSFCVEHHNYHIRNCIIQRDLLHRILVLMKSKHTFLVLSKSCQLSGRLAAILIGAYLPTGALRFLRKIIGLKDEFYVRHIVAGSLLGPVVDALLSNKGRYNLLDSAVIELFEFIRTEEIKSLCVHLIDKYGSKLDAIDYVRTFKGLKAQYELHQDRCKDRDSLEA